MADPLTLSMGHTAGTPAERDDWFGCYGGSLKAWLVPAAFQHPAKFSRRLIERIYTHGLAEGWLVPGQTVLDPMAGVGTGAIPAANAGLHWEGMELEPHFVQAGQAVLDKHQRTWEQMRKPIPVLREGDARHLRGQADCVVSSPPYANEAVGGAVAAWVLRVGETHGIEEAVRQYRLKVMGHLPKHGRWTDDNIRAHIEESLARRRGSYSAVVTSPPFLGARSDTTPSRRGATAPTRHDPEGMRQPSAILTSPPYPDQVHGGNGIDPAKLTGNPTGPHSQVFAQGYSAIVTSPQFSPDQPTASQSGLLAAGYEAFKSPLKRDPTHAGATPGQIGALPIGDVQAVITSPPYAGGGHHPDQTGSWGGLQEEKRIGLGTKQAAGYGATSGQVGRMPTGEIDAIITSPPWENTPEGNKADGKKGVWGRDAAARQKRDYAQMASLTGDTYWAAMRQVYDQCFALLPLGGHMLLVLKGFVRHGQYVDLPAQTCQLLEAVGFRVLHRHRAWLVAKEGQARFDGGEDRRAFKSFFRRIQERRGVPAVDFEEVVCAEKP